MPKVERQRLLGYRDDGTILVHDLSGRQLLNRKLELPDTGHVSIRDISAAPDGSIAVTASVIGAGAVSVIVWIDSQGSVVRAVRTSPFAAFHITFDADGSLWAVGREHDQNFADTPDHEILRRYDTSGRLAGSMLPRRELRPSGKQHPARQSFLISNGTRIGLYCATSNDWFDLSAAGAPAHLQPSALPAGFDPLSGALTPEGVLYVFGRDQSRSATAPILYYLKPDSGEWIPENTSTLTRRDIIGGLVGSDSQRLAFAGAGGVAWARIAR